MQQASPILNDQPDAPFMAQPFEVMPGVYCLPAWLPVPGEGLLPVNAFLLDGREPTLVDTGLGALREDFMLALKSVIDVARIRWIWLSHTDADHIGNLCAVCAEAPEATLVTSFLGQGKMAMLDALPARLHLVEEGGVLETADRALKAIRPPYYDAPETLGFMDMDGGPLFCGDAFGALMANPAERMELMDPEGLGAGLVGWAGIDAPWLGLVDRARFSDRLEALMSLKAETILSGHLPPAGGLQLPRLASLALDAQATAAAISSNHVTP